MGNEDACIICMSELGVPLFVPPPPRVAASAQPQPQPPPHRHTLVHHTCCKQHTCDLCDAACSTVSRCDLCDYDECVACHARQAPPSVEAPAPAPAPAPEPAPEPAPAPAAPVASADVVVVVSPLKQPPQPQDVLSDGVCRLACGHAFHGGCMLQYLRSGQDRACPLCKGVPPGAEEPPTATRPPLPPPAPRDAVGTVMHVLLQPALWLLLALKVVIVVAVILVVFAVNVARVAVHACVLLPYALLLCVLRCGRCRPNEARHLCKLTWQPFGVAVAAGA